MTERQFGHFVTVYIIKGDISEALDHLRFKYLNANPWCTAKSIFLHFLCIFFIQEVKTDTAKTDTSEKITEKEVTTPSKDEEVKDVPSADEVEEKVKKSPKKEAPKKKTKPVEETKKPLTPKRKKVESESDENEEGSSTKQSN